MNLFVFTTILVGFLASFSEATTGTDEVSFGTLRLELHSKSSSEARVLLADLSARTTVFLDSQLDTYFSNTISDDYFSHNGLGVVELNIEETNGIFAATVDFDGAAFFTTVPIPGTNFIVDLLTKAFQGSSRLEYVRELQLSDTPFLADITYLVVELNGRVIATEDLSHGTGTNDAEDDDEFWTNKMLMIVTGVSAGFGTLCIAAVFCFLCNCRKKKPLRVKTALSNQDTDADVESPVHSPSPIHSLCSQESSKFTYNPQYATSNISALTFDTKTLSSNFSALDVDVDNAINMEAWTRQNTISPVAPAPFGNDISAIEQSQADLNLILEGTYDEKAPAPHRSKSKLTKAALNDFDNKVFNIDWKKRTKPTKPNELLNDSSHSEEVSYEVSDTSDVINDLKNLSLQINSHRTVKSSSLYGPSHD